MAGRIPIATILKTTLIYNPFAGGLKRRIERLLPRTLHILNETGLRVSAIPTTGPRQAGAIARYAVENGSDLILALGGDGTINEVVNGMAHSGVPLGILPGGTANVLASELGIGRSVELAAALIAQSVPRRVSLGLLRCENAEPRYFVMMAGAGLDAKIVYNLNLTLKGVAGKLAYYLSGFAQLGSRLAEFPVRADEHSSLASFALASRVRNYGGDLEIARGASLYHDHFELVLFHGSNSLRYLKYLAGVATRRLERTEGVSILRAIQVAFGPGVPIQVDGEYAGRTPASIEIASQALTLLVPPAFHEKESTLARAAAGEWITSPTR